MPYEFLDFEIDPLRFRLSRRDAPLPLPRQIFDLMVFLIRHRDRPVSKDEILDAVWHGRSVTIASLTHAVARARKILGDTPDSQSIIKTVHGRGYWWVAETVETGVVGESLVVPHSLPFVGRASELSVLSGSLSEAARGRGRLVLVAGEAGAGKSRLVERFSARASREGAIVVRACAEDLQPTPPFYLWRQVVRQLSERPGVHLSTNLALLIGTSARLSQEQGARLRRDIESHRESAAERARLYEELEALLSSTSNAGPLVVVLEDMHQADPSSMQALDHLAGALERMRVLAIATHRPPQESPGLAGKAALAKLARQNSATAIALQGLSRLEVEALLRELADPRLPVSASGLVFDASAGNPFFVTQIVTLARSRAGVRRRSDLSNLPTAVREAISAHAKELPGQCFQVLTAAAVLGRVFDIRVLAEMIESELHQLSRSLRVGTDAGIVKLAKDAGHFEFSHALLREALYEETDQHSRSLLHLAAGTAMLRILGADCRDQLPAIASHFREAILVGGRERAIGLLERCGEWAQRDLAFADAAQFFSEALELRSGQAQRDLPAEAKLLLSLGSARLCSGDRSGARQALLAAADLAAEYGGAEDIAEAALRMSPSVLSLETGVVDPVLISVLERALGAVDQDDESLRLALTGRLALALYWSDEQARRSDLVLTLRDSRVRDPLEQVRALLFAIGADWGPGSLADRRVALDEIHSRRHQLSAQLSVVARVFRVATFLEAGCIDAMDREIEVLEAELGVVGTPYGAWYPLMFRATQGLIRGEYDRAVNLAGTYLQAGVKFDDANVLHSFAAQVAEAEWLRGRAGAALEVGKQFAERFASMAEWRCAVAFLLAIAGRGAEAEALLDRLGARDFETVRGSSRWTIATCSLAEAAWRLRIKRWAPVLYDMLLPYREQNAVAGFGVLSWGSISRFLGLLAGLMERWEDSEDLLSQAIQSDSRAGAPSWSARSEMALALVLDRRGTKGSRERAALLASRACARVRGLGVVQIERDALEAGLSAGQR